VEIFVGLWDFDTSAWQAVNVLCAPPQWKQVYRPSLMDMGETRCAMRAGVFTASEQRD